MNGRRVSALTIFMVACVWGSYQLKVDSDRTIQAPSGAGYGQSSVVVGTGTSTTLAVGAPLLGKVYLHRGIHLPKTPPWTFGGQTFTFTGASGGEAGWSVAAGRFAGDSTQDLVIGAPSEAGGAGKIYIIDGDDLGTGNLTAADAAVVIEGVSTANYAGWSLAPGDFNGDGTPDLAVGACGWNYSVGAIYVVYGPLPAQVDLADHLRITGTPVPPFGSQTKDGLGCVLAAADLDLDWDDELIAPTTWGSGNAQGGAGKVHVLYELPAQNTTVLDIADRVTYTSTRQWEGLGHAVTVADVNDDLAPDLLLGAPHYFCDFELARTGVDPCQNLANDEGRVYAVLSALDDHLPGTPQTLNITAAAGVTISGTEPDFGRALDVGDVDNDTIDDVLIGQPRSSQGFLFYGDPDAGTAGYQQLDTLDAHATFSTPDVGGASSVLLADMTGDKKAESTLITMGQPWVYSAAQGPGFSHIVFGE